MHVYNLDREDPNLLKVRHRIVILYEEGTSMTIYLTLIFIALSFAPKVIFNVI